MIFQVELEPLIELVLVFIQNRNKCYATLAKSVGSIVIMKKIQYENEIYWLYKYMNVYVNK